MPRPAPLLAGVLAMLLLAGCGGETEPDPGVQDDAGREAEQATSAAPEAATDGGNLLDVAIDIPEGEALDTLAVGTDALDIDAVALNGGVITADRDSFGEPALRFPAFSLDDEPPRAIVRVTQDASGGVLDVGEDTFTFGVDFALDAVSFGTTVDGGNNLIQRGLASGESQFKIDSDGSNVLCRVAGLDGILEARITADLEAGEWYRVRCVRRDESVELSLAPLSVVGSTVRVTEEGPLGALSFEEGVPLSLGGKLAANGAVIRSATDQFNGVLAQPFLTVGEER